MAYSQDLEGGNSTIGRAAATPGTFPGMIARLESLIKKARAVRDHAENAREKIDGTRAPGEAIRGPTVQAVKSGFISEMDDLFGDLERVLGASDEALEHIWSKVS